MLETAAMHDAFTAAIAYVTTYGLSVLGGFIILLVGWIVAGWASQAVDATLGRFHRFDLMLRRFIASVVRSLPSFPSSFKPPA